MTLNLKNFVAAKDVITEREEKWLDKLSGLNCVCGKEMVNGEVEYIGMCCVCDEKMRAEQEKNNG